LFKRSLLLKARSLFEEALEAADAALRESRRYGLRRLEVYSLTHIGDLRLTLDYPDWWRSSAEAVGLAHAIGYGNYAEKLQHELVNDLREQEWGSVVLNDVAIAISDMWADIGVPDDHRSALENAVCVSRRNAHELADSRI
jgi:hypothetical protein